MQEKNLKTSSEDTLSGSQKTHEKLTAGQMLRVLEQRLHTLAGFSNKAGGVEGAASREIKWGFW